MAIKAIAGAHLTVTNRRHISAILANGWLQGESARLSYKLVPIEGAAAILPSAGDYPSALTPSRI